MSAKFRLPPWNELTTTQRDQICREAEFWADEYIESDAAHSMYNRIRDLVAMECPPLLLRMAADAPSGVTATGGELGPGTNQP